MQNGRWLAACLDYVALGDTDAAGWYLAHRMSLVLESRAECVFASIRVWLELTHGQILYPTDRFVRMHCMTSMG